MSDLINKILSEEGIRLTELLQQSLRDKGVTYQEGDSRLSGKIRFKFSDNEGSTLFYLYMPNYWEAVDKGRKKGYVPIAPLINWIKRKGIDVRPKTATTSKKKVKYADLVKRRAYAISIAKSKKATPGNNFYSDVIPDWKNNLEKRISEAMKKEITIKLLQ